MTVLQTQTGLRQVQGPNPLFAAGGGVTAGGFIVGVDGGSERNAIGFDEVYASQPAVASVVNKLFRTFSSVPLKVYRMTDDGDRVRVRSNSTDQGSSLAGLLERPWTRCGASHLKQWISMPALIFGNSVLAKYRPADGGPPTALYPLDWRRLSAWAELGAPVAQWSTMQFGSEMTIPAEETLHFAWSSPLGWIGVSPLEQLTKTVTLDDAASREQTALISNASRMGGWISPPEGVRLKDDAMKRMEAALEEKHQGPDKAGRVGLLGPGAKFYPDSFSPADMQVQAMRLFNREEICICYDVKPPIIGDLSHTNYSSLVELNRDFHMTTMRPWYTMAEETLQAQLIEPEPEWQGLFVEFDLDEVLRGDPMAEAQALEVQFQSAQITPAEMRKVRNRPRTGQPGEDLLYAPVNNLQPLGAPVTAAPQAVSDIPGEMPPDPSGDTPLV